MKAIEVKMVDIMPMSVSMALEYGTELEMLILTIWDMKLLIQTDINLGVLKM